MLKKIMSEKILIIKLGALGDFMQSFSFTSAIRKHHKDAHITLLTSKPFVTFAQDSGYFDAVYIDDKPKAHNILGWLKLRQWFNAQKFTRIYDLQNNDRSRAYFKLLKNPKPEWVGTAKGASHENNAPQRTTGHAFDGHVQTLALAGITNIKIDDLSFVQADISEFNLKKPYVLLAPGCAPSRPEKRWPAENFAALANELVKQGKQPVLIGTQDDKAATDKIVQLCPEALDLNSQTSLAQIIALGREAEATVGNDTGPMHMIAPTGCPCTVLFSGASDPVKHAPRGKSVRVLRENNIADIKVSDVL